jgi:hypothetical protein
MTEIEEELDDILWDIQKATETLRPVAVGIVK